MKKNFKIFISSILLILIACGGIAYITVKPFSIHNGHVTPKEVNLVALGDSLTQGIGDQNKNGGYVSMISQDLSQNHWTKVNANNYGVAGEKSNQIDSRLKKQLPIQSHIKKANIIVLTAGGNDLLQTLEANVFDNHQKFIHNFNNNQSAYKHNLTKLIRNVRDINHHANIYIFGIYNPFYVYFPNVNLINSSIQSWNQTTIKSIHHFHRIHFVNINDLSYGQYQTQNSRKHLINSNSNNGDNLIKLIQLIHNSNGELNHYLSKRDHFHPNNKGYQLMTKRLYHKIKNNQILY